jgi:hypothetical protein
MLSTTALYEISRARFREARILLNDQEPDGAVHLCGYALECILKMKIVEKLNWDGFPEINKEFEHYKSFRTHDLNVLLRLSGHEKLILGDLSMNARWQVAKSWNSEIRYQQIGTMTEMAAKDILDATREIIVFLIRA